ncbi:uncharacterized protein MELLADRAFT_114264 [Melampsora larici-populina 98AG31]|uniref:Uncharacterized protein n=1 Tax=Melampsora larici-populina (strain 98AG31 / pathotype 3-4-7) TaxID=747676 RepID=F4SCU6_MELLP|nr:uncharacterized protein MELLADRAFT_114264 [Melampsora larici-populina 98AG31]EGF97527.1 hypothetical protein MELLADRAFT_114264 [Melampsora larici-populina 98AG31]
MNVSNDTIMDVSNNHCYNVSIHYGHAIKLTEDITRLRPSPWPTTSWSHPTIPGRTLGYLIHTSSSRLQTPIQSSTAMAPTRSSSPKAHDSPPPPAPGPRRGNRLRKPRSTGIVQRQVGVTDPQENSHSEDSAPSQSEGTDSDDSHSKSRDSKEGNASKISP